MHLKPSVFKQLAAAVRLTVIIDKQCEDNAFSIMIVLSTLMKRLHSITLFPSYTAHLCVPLLPECDWNMFCRDMNIFEMQKQMSMQRVI